MRASTTIYLFQSGEVDRYALSLDKTCPWQFLRGSCAASLNPDELPDDMAPALRHLVQHGFSILSVEDGPAP